MKRAAWLAAFDLRVASESVAADHRDSACWQLRRRGSSRSLPGFRGGSLQALVLFVQPWRAGCTSAIMGFTFPCSTCKPSIPSPFRMLGLTSKCIAAVWAAVILMVLSRFPGEDRSGTRLG